MFQAIKTLFIRQSNKVKETTEGIVDCEHCPSSCKLCQYHKMHLETDTQLMLDNECYPEISLFP